MVTSYSFRMTNVKTTVYLDAADYRRLKALAATEGRPTAELIRTAVAEYARRHRPASLPSSLGVGASGDGTLSERVEELLTGLGDEA
jgi:predicted DNA-binding ribbon-helix-helix protein